MNLFPDSQVIVYNGSPETSVLTFELVPFRQKLVPEMTEMKYTDIVLSVAPGWRSGPRPAETAVCPASTYHWHLPV